MKNPVGPPCIGISVVVPTIVGMKQLYNPRGLERLVPTETHVATPRRQSASFIARSDYI